MFLVYRKNRNSEVLEKTVNDLVCGDGFLVSGQSNAVSAFDLVNGGTTQDALYSNPYCRAIGACLDIAFSREQSPNPTSIAADYIFARPSCIYWQDGFTGAWALKMQNELANQSGVPSCMVNNAWSARSIVESHASAYPSNIHHLNLYTSYDRGYKKLSLYGLTHYVKGIFWYQGETDTVSNTHNYFNSFEQVYKSWKDECFCRK